MNAAGESIFPRAGIGGPMPSQGVACCTAPRSVKILHIKRRTERSPTGRSENPHPHQRAKRSKIWRWNRPLDRALIDRKTAATGFATTG
jgi:hypothetical protein